MSYLRYLCLFAYSGVHHILCCVFMFCLSSSCVPNVTSVSELSILDCPFCFRTVSCVPSVASISGFSLRFSLTFIFVPCLV